MLATARFLQVKLVNPRDWSESGDWRQGHTTFSFPSWLEVARYSRHDFQYSILRPVGLRIIGIDEDHLVRKLLL